MNDGCKKDEELGVGNDGIVNSVVEDDGKVEGK